ncbi:hypothetical protein Aph02nite_50300 [Actinoplanes philippinensis]|uniref:Uncharacterized protein n=1 Tax=Actinoplanes philippinensis TaxID=35752 RepID=A0A1I2IQ58_9ACTN|nr:hypothetical protein [Actinoplanes philippinensis]GIE79080.1 hypothetical protein Aph02nite_50300 [Actinoplanes philippinensis]SFF44409.1 hypothetical protein SAMN05421541_110332 [Actinoplanes philippinensis]
MRWWEAGLPGNDRDEIPVDDEIGDPQPSIMRLLLPPDEVERLEIAPGQWYLPGTPP